MANSMNAPSADPTNLMVNYLPPDVDNAGLSSMFSHYGEVASAKVVVDPGTSNSKGYGFVRMTRVEDAELAIANLHGSNLSNKTLKVHYATPPATSNKRQLYVAGFNPTYTAETLMELFGQFGDAIGAKTLPPKSGQNGVGFVEFSSTNEADKALNSTNGVEWDGHILAVKWPRVSGRAWPPRTLPRPHNGPGMAHGGGAGGGPPPSVDPSAFQQMASMPKVMPQ